MALFFLEFVSLFQIDILGSPLEKFVKGSMGFHNQRSVELAFFEALDKRAHHQILQGVRRFKFGRREPFQEGPKWFVIFLSDTEQSLSRPHLPTRAGKLMKKQSFQLAKTLNYSIFQLTEPGLG